MGDSYRIVGAVVIAMSMAHYSGEYNPHPTNLSFSGEVLPAMDHFEGGANPLREVIWSGQVTRSNGAPLASHGNLELKIRWTDHDGMVTRINESMLVDPSHYINGPNGPSFTVAMVLALRGYADCARVEAVLENKISNVSTGTIICW